MLRTVNDHSVMGSQLLIIAGKRLAHFIYVCDPPGSVEKLAQCAPTVSTWLKQMVCYDKTFVNKMNINNILAYNLFCLTLM